MGSLDPVHHLGVLGVWMDTDAAEVQIDSPVVLTHEHLGCTDTYPGSMAFRAVSTTRLTVFEDPNRGGSFLVSGEEYLVLLRRTRV